MEEDGAPGNSLEDFLPGSTDDGFGLAIADATATAGADDAREAMPLATGMLGLGAEEAMFGIVVQPEK